LKVRNYSLVGDEYPAGIFICGPCGTGKTHLAAAILRFALESGLAYREKSDLRDGSIRAELSARFKTVPDLLMDLRGTFGENGYGTESWIVREHRGFRVLIMDDLGAEKITDFSLSSLYLILANRLDNESCTVVTSNLGLKDLHAWDPRIASRLGGLPVLELVGRDRRLIRNQLDRLLERV
jgi:DNA replication protein DnaC